MSGRRRKSLLAGAGVFVTVCAIGYVLGGATPGEAAFPGSNGKIAFVSGQDGNCEIYLVDPDGTGLTRLTSNPAREVSPAWSPDGTKIAFSTNRDGNEEIYVMNADGSGQQNLTQHPADDFTPAWSPDGRIAFTSTRDGNREVYVMNADGGGLANLTQNAASDDSDPAWSPDGSTIAFVSNRDGNFDLYLMDASGGNVRNLTQDASAVVARADWSPDGTKLALMRAVNVASSYQIYVINADGTGLHTVSPGHGITPAWSPDGTKIAFTSGGIHLINPDGSGLMTIVGSTGCDGFPNWQPIVNRPPDCSTVTASPNRLWPPSHKLRLATLSGATDPDSDTVTLTITGVTQDEPLNGLGDGDTSPDAQAGTQSNTVLLRAERSGAGDGRVYRIAFTGSDGRGGTCSGTVTVGVPHDMGAGSNPVDSAPPSFNSFGP